VPEPTIAVGHVTKAHGIRGEVAVEIRSDNPDRFVEGATLFTDDGRSLTIERAHAHGARMLVKFSEVDDRHAGEPACVLVVRVWLPELPEKVLAVPARGCACAPSQAALSAVSRSSGPANDLWVAVGVDGEETGARDRDVTCRRHRRETHRGARRAGPHRSRRGEPSGRGRGNLPPCASMSSIFPKLVSAPRRGLLGKAIGRACLTCACDLRD
jgi:hypothetical protein